MDLVSVIIPYYKKSQTIKKTIKSVLSQTYKNIELIIVYDDEDNKDLEFLKKIKKNSKKIFIFVNKSNLGAGISRNIGIKNSKGKYIAFIDADDIWNKNKLDKQISFMKEKNIFVCHTSYKVTDFNGNLLSLRKAKTFSTVKSLIKSCDIGLSTVVIKKSIFKKEIKFPSLKTKEDFVLWLRLLKKKHSIVGFDEYLTEWKKVKNSLSSSIIQKLNDGYKVYNTYMRFSFIKSLYLLLCLSINSLKK